MPSRPPRTPSTARQPRRTRNYDPCLKNLEETGCSWPVSFCLLLVRRVRRGWPGAPLLHRQQFDVEHQRRVRRDHAAGAARAIAEIGWDDQRALAADLHGRNAFVPTGDHLALADRKFERLVAVYRRVEFLALLAVLVEPTGIMHDADLPRLRRSAGAFLA